MQTLPQVKSSPSNSSDNSIAPLISEAKKHFQINASKQYRNVILDQQAYLSFPPHIIHNQIPAGVYHPSSTHHENFVLSRVSTRNNYNDDVDQDMLDLLAALGEEPDTYRELGTDYIRQIQKEQQINYLGSNYFPTHKYNLNLKRVHEGIINFLNNKEFYEENNLGFKRSILLYGSHGVGKSRYFEFLVYQLIKELSAITIRIDSSQDVKLLNDYGLLTLNRVIENRLIILIIEEVASIVTGRDGHIGLLNILDNSLLRENLLVLSTTNTPSRIPSNVLRNQRVDVLEEIRADNYNDQFPIDFYQFIFQEEFPEKYRDSEWVEMKLNPADLKELFLYAKINDVDIDTSFKQLKKRNRTVENRFQATNHLGF